MASRIHASCLAPTTTRSSSIAGHASDVGGEGLRVHSPIVAGVTRFDRPAGRSRMVSIQRFLVLRFFVVFFADLVDFDARFAAFAFAARAARALTRFCASFARASGERGRRFLATFLVAFVARRPVVTGGRPTAGLTSATSTLSPNMSRATIAAWYWLLASTISTEDRLKVTR